MSQKKNQFGTFQGVFTPSILTILGVIMYMRFGWVQGQVGFLGTLIIVTLSTSITFLTGLSSSTLATNQKVGGGGAYFMISRSLGIEIGATIGLWLYLAQALSVSFYIAGFTESLKIFFPEMDTVLWGIVVLTAIMFLIFVSTSIALKAQFFILALIVLSLISFFLGHPVSTDQLNNPEMITQFSFWSCFAVFFPAVTGILSGIGMSGDLKNPSQSIPQGTLGAILVSYLIYMIIPFFMKFYVNNNDLLISNPLIMTNIARWPIFIFCGIWGATISSALGSLLTAPRTLQALSKDSVTPRFFSNGFMKSKEPQKAILFSYIIAFLGIVLGDLNVIAPVLSMFFLMTYGLLNISSAFETLIAPPSWRPSFKTHWILSFIGGLSCFMVMFLINGLATLIALILSIITFYYLKKRQLAAVWGDVQYGLIHLVAKHLIHKLENQRMDIKNWIPQFLVFSGNPCNRWHLIQLADLMNHDKNILTIATVYKEIKLSYERKQDMKKTIKDYIHERDISALVKVHFHQNPYQGIMDLINCYGFGQFIPNTVIIGQIENKENLDDYVSLIQHCHNNKKNMMIIQGDPRLFEKQNYQKLDVWWNQKSKNAGLSLALSYLLRKSRLQNQCELRLNTIIKEKDKGVSKKHLEEFIKESRFEAIPLVHCQEDGESPFDVILNTNNDQSLPFIGLNAPSNLSSTEEFKAYYESILEKFSSLSMSVFILAAEDKKFKNIFITE